MSQPLPSPNQPWSSRGAEEQTAQIPQYNPAWSQSSPPPAAPKRKRRWPWVVGGLVVLGVIGSGIGDDDEPTPHAGRGLRPGCRGARTRSGCSRSSRP